MMAVKYDGGPPPEARSWPGVVCLKQLHAVHPCALSACATTIGQWTGLCIGLLLLLLLIKVDILLGWAKLLGCAPLLLLLLELVLLQVVVVVLLIDVVLLLLLLPRVLLLLRTPISMTGLQREAASNALLLLRGPRGHGAPHQGLCWRCHPARLLRCHR